MERLEGKIPDFYSYNLDKTIRFKLIKHIQSNIENDEVSDLIYSLEMELGREISKESIYDDEKLENFLYTCSNKEFLSAIELLISIKFNDDPIYRMLVEGSSGIRKSTGEELKRNPHPEYVKKEEKFRNFIITLNEIFKTDKIGYEIVPVSLPRLPYMIVPFNSQYLYVETIRYPMSLMYDAEFLGPLNEFEEALDEYRKEEYKDAIHKANKAYESTLKTILDIKDKEYTNKDNIPNLIDKIRKETDIFNSELNSAFDSVWSVLKNGPQTIRNIVAHGQGKEVKEMQKSYTDFVLRLVGTYIVFLIDRYNETKELGSNE